MKANFEALTLKPFNPQKIQARKINFPFSIEIPKLWHENSVATTHFCNSVSLFLPGLESFTVRLLKKHLNQVKDPELKKQTLGFLSQEAIHGAAHEQYNQMLRQQGYKIDTWLKIMDYLLIEIVEKRSSNKVRLAFIAGFEHLTTLLSEIVLKVNLFKSGDCDSRMCELWQWHCMEEIEHSSLAFVLLQEEDKSYWLRAIGGLLGVAIVYGFMFFGMVVLMLQEPECFTWKTLIDLKQLFFTKYKIISYGWKPMLEYYKFNFHPRNQDILSLAENVSLSLSQNQIYVN
jgi:predicted metal-dependent hydrolase